MIRVRAVSMYFCYMQIATFFWLANEYSILAIKLKSKSDELNDSDHEKKFQFRKKFITIVCITIFLIYYSIRGYFVYNTAKC